MVLANSSKATKYHRLFVTGARTVMMISKTALVLWMNALLKKRDVVLSKVSLDITYEHKIEMQNASVFCSTGFFPLQCHPPSCRKV